MTEKDKVKNAAIDIREEMTKDKFVKEFYQECWSCVLERHPENCQKFRDTHKLTTHLMNGDVKIGCGYLK
ncbi:MAG: hypothetical protein D4S01_11515 [Dehalococcoidia bacterium]|nr:MAG: hypothetical protein D4S01_11515 [Dehalococcoidia bacterium]